MLLWEKILLTFTIIDFVTCLILIFIMNINQSPDDSIVTKLAVISLMIFAIEFFAFILYLLVFKVILGAIWDVNIQLFSFM